MGLHIKYCEGFGVSKEEMVNVEENMACTAYTRYVLDIGMSEDWIGLQLALAPCLLGYGVVARQLHADERSVRGETNRYWTWIENYVADDYVQAVKTGSGKCRGEKDWRRGIAANEGNRTIRETRCSAVSEQNRRVGKDLHTCNQGKHQSIN